MKNNRLFHAGLAVLAASLAMDVLDHGHEGHGVTALPGFDFVLGLLCALILGVTAKVVMYRLIGRKTDYYEVKDR